MERLTITIRPAHSDEGLLLVADAMQQVIDLVRLHEEASRALATPGEAFEWRLERASTNSPFTVTAIAEPRDPTVDVSGYVQTIKGEVKRGIEGLLRDRELASWMGPESLHLVRSVFGRTQNGISITEIEFSPNDRLRITRAEADVGIQAISAMTAITVDLELGEREALGEIQGVMVAVGRHYNRPAIAIQNELYGLVWCRLPQHLIDDFGGEHKVNEVWKGQTLGVDGRLIYGSGGRLSRIEVTWIRVIPDTPPLDLDSALDPGFTAGLDPVEYLRRLHEGELA